MSDPVFVHPDAQIMIDRAAAAMDPPIESLSPEAARLQSDARMIGAPLGRPEMVEIRDIEIPVSGGAITLRLYRPVEAARLPTCMFFHGGGFMLGSLETHDALCRSLAAQSGAAFVSVGFRLSPEHKFPIPIEDCLTATRWVRAHADALGLNAAKMAVAGESSGGNIALAVSRLIAEAEEAPLAAQVLIYPAVDMRTDGPTWERFATGYLLTRARARFYLSQYLRNEADEDDPRASPLRASDPSIWPNTFILTASLDGTSGDAEAFAQRLRDAGVAVEHRRFEGWPHGFLFWGHREGGDAAITAAAHYLARALT